MDNPNVKAVFPAEDWISSTPEKQGISSEKLQKAIEYLTSQFTEIGTDRTVIIRNGYMVWSGSDIDARSKVWSCTKSFTSTVLGLLIEDGKCTIDDYAVQYVPELQELYSQVKLAHFATMTSGYNGSGKESAEQDRYARPLDQAEPLFIPGSKYLYWDEAIAMYTWTLKHIANEEISTLFNRRIAQPIGMTNFEWQDYEPRPGLITTCGSGRKGMHISARDFARFGLLFLNKGNWSGQQLVNREWVETATMKHVPADLPGTGIPRGYAGQGLYGYNWWTNGLNSEGERHFKDAPVDMFWAEGTQSNFCFVIPQWDMVIVRIGKKDNIDKAHYNHFLSMVGEAL